MSKYHNIVREFNARAWAITPEKLAELSHVLTTRVTGGVIPADVVAAYKEAAAQRRAETPAGGSSVAVIPVYGTISQRPDLMSSGGTSTQELGAQFDAAMSNPSVGAIVFDVDSPGGSVSGVPELAAKIRNARGQGKQIIAVANSLAASAAYWIASAADEFVASPSADVGSIGVYAAHVDASAMLESEGLKYTLISAGKYKVEGSPYEPLSDEARAAMQASVDEFYAMFTSDVAKNRGVSVKDVRNGYGEGRVLTAKSALAAGMIDRIDTLDGVLNDLTKGAKSTTRRAAMGGHIPASADLIDLVAATLIADRTLASFSTLPKGAASVVSVPTEPASPAVHSADATPDTAPSDEPSTATDDEASAADALPTLETAPQARSNTVPNENTAANGAAPSEAPVSREVQIGQLAQLAGKDLAWTMNAITSGLSVQAIQSQLASERLSNAAPATTGTISVGVDRATQKPFASLGEQLMAVVKAGKGLTVDPRLNRLAAASGMNESVGSEGGFLVETQFLSEITKSVFENDPILSRVKRIPSSAASVKYNVVDETSRATGSRWGGVQVYWAAEADTVTAKKPKLRQMVLEKKKVMGLAYLTDELSQDGPAAQSLVVDAFNSELAFTIANAVFRGTGSGQPLGWMNSGAVVSQAIESTQTIANTDTFIAKNVSKMLARIPSSLWGEVVFLYNQDLYPKIVNATNGSSGAIPLYMGMGGLANAQSDTILGRPAYASELCEAEGTVGDIMAIVPSQYHVLGGDSTTFSESIHVRFLYDENTLKFTTRVDGAPVWNSAITRYKGATTLSPFVTLATRS
jgi:HK97 family phage major capsid protein